MATFSCSLSAPFPPRLLYTNKIRTIPLRFPNFRTNPTFQSSKIQATNSASVIKDEEEAISIDNLHRFVKLNLGNWNGSFYQFDVNGKVAHIINTKLSASSYGENELISLIQTLYIKQPPCYGEEPEWGEYKIKESNMFTVDQYQQLGFFPSERAFALRYQTAGMLETVLRQGVFGEDDIGEESPKNLKLPSNRPSIVCENCLYSTTKDMRARAFHIMDPKGVLDMLILFLEARGSSVDDPPSFEDSEFGKDRLLPFLGRWKGHSITKRSGVYGATIAKHDTVASLQMNENGQLIQDITTTRQGDDITTNVQWRGAIYDNLIKFDKGFQLTLLPGGMYMGFPSDISKSVAESKPFHFEFCWLESPDKRQRLVRTYDVEGLAVSSTYFFETKI